MDLALNNIQRLICHKTFIMKECFFNLSRFSLNAIFSNSRVSFMFDQYALTCCFLAGNYKGFIFVIRSVSFRSLRKMSPFFVIPRSLFGKWKMQHFVYFSIVFSLLTQCYIIKEVSWQILFSSLLQEVHCPSMSFRCLLLSIELVMYTDSFCYNKNTPVNNDDWIFFRKYLCISK